MLEKNVRQTLMLFTLLPRNLFIAIGYQPVKLHIVLRAQDSCWHSRYSGVKSKKVKSIVFDFVEQKFIECLREN